MWGRFLKHVGRAPAILFRALARFRHSRNFAFSENRTAVRTAKKHHLDGPSGPNQRYIRTQLLPTARNCAAGPPPRSGLSAKTSEAVMRASWLLRGAGCRRPNIPRQTRRRRPPRARWQRNAFYTAQGPALAPLGPPLPATGGPRAQRNRMWWAVGSHTNKYRKNHLRTHQNHLQVHSPF